MLGQFTASVTYNERVKCRSERGSFGRRGGEEHDKATRPIVRAACRPMLRRARIVTSTYPRGTHPRREGRLLLSPSPSPLTSPRSPVAAEKGLPHSSVGAQFGGLRRGIDLHPPAHLPGRVLRDLARPPAAISLPLSLSPLPSLLLSFPFSRFLETCPRVHMISLSKEIVLEIGSSGSWSESLFLKEGSDPFPSREGSMG